MRVGILKDKLNNDQKSAVRSYQDVILGTRSPRFLARYEATMLLCNSCAGALGLGLRKSLYPALFHHVGQGTVFGRNIALRNTRKIAFGNGCIIDDNCALDGSSTHELGISIGDQAMIARNVQISSKGGRIRIGQNASIGANAELRAVESNVLDIGDDVLIAPSVYLGGTRYHFDRMDIPIAHQGIDARGGVRIGSGCWLGAAIVVIDGVTIGRDAIIAAGSVVTDNIPDFAIAGGIPARVIRRRGSAIS